MCTTAHSFAFSSSAVAANANRKQASLNGSAQGARQ
jgi:hypothetical protein